MNDRRSVLSCTDLHKIYVDGAREVNVLMGIDLDIKAGECVAILGPSGSGKSTLLHLLGGLDKPTVGKVLVDNKDLTQLSEQQRCQLRNHALGVVYQFHHLLPEFSALENVAMPLLIAGEKPASAQLKAKAILVKIGLEERLQHKLAQLSGGERQRTAIARALVTGPLCVLADEPTGNLDQHTAENVYTMMLELNRSLQMSLLIVTHDINLANKMDRILYLQDGILQGRGDAP